MWLSKNPVFVAEVKNAIFFKRINESNKWLILNLLFETCILIELKFFHIFHVLALPSFIFLPYYFIACFILAFSGFCALSHLILICRLFFEWKLQNRQDFEVQPERAQGSFLCEFGPSAFRPTFANLNISPSKSPSLAIPQCSGARVRSALSINNIFGHPCYPFSSSPCSSLRNFHGENSLDSAQTISLQDICLSPVTKYSDSGRSWLQDASSPNRFGSSARADPVPSLLWHSDDNQKYQYQLSCSPHSSEKRSRYGGKSNVLSTSDSNLMRSLSASAITEPRYVPLNDKIQERSAEEYWTEHGVSSALLEQYTVDLRKWLHGTIFRPLVDEITTLNKHLSETTGEDTLIGSTSFDTLQQLRATKYHYLPTLPMLLLFLELMKDQGYLVNRLKELARGSHLEDFRWDSGSKNVKLPWKEHLPNDSLIVLHMLATYMDACMPPHPKCLTGRAFSQLCVVRHPDKPDLKSKYSCQIYQVNVQPPHFESVLGGEIYALSPGPQNLFHAILMIFHQAFLAGGKFRSVSLGPSGLNIAWIFKKK